MKSIKPGRAPSFIGFAGSILTVVFGLFWLMLVNYLFEENNESGTLPYFFFILFGIGFVIVGIGMAIYNYKNTFSKNRFSVLDIEDSSEEGKPSDSETPKNSLSDSLNYCPYCGNPIEKSFSFCPKCGKKLRS